MQIAAAHGAARTPSPQGRERPPPLSISRCGDDRWGDDRTGSPPPPLVYTLDSAAAAAAAASPLRQRRSLLVDCAGSSGRLSSPSSSRLSSPGGSASPSPSSPLREHRRSVPHSPLTPPPTTPPPTTTPPTLMPLVPTQQPPLTPSPMYCRPQPLPSAAATASLLGVGSDACLRSASASSSRRHQRAPPAPMSASSSPVLTRRMPTQAGGDGGGCGAAFGSGGERGGGGAGKQGVRRKPGGLQPLHAEMGPGMEAGVHGRSGTAQRSRSVDPPTCHVRSARAAPAQLAVGHVAVAFMPVPRYVRSCAHTLTPTCK